jgi:cysteine desulfurase
MRVYLDNAATTAMSQAAIEAMLPFITGNYGNPSSDHKLGKEAAETVAASRSIVAGALNAKSEEIYFTSSGTEANNWALNIAAELGRKANKRHIITTAIEHPSILNVLRKLKKQEFEVTLLPVQSNGIVKLSEIENSIRNDTVLVSVMYVNNEIGTIQPIEEIGEICRSRGVFFHTDAVQAMGYMDINVNREFIDLLSLSAHKFYGPKGVGALYCSKLLPTSPFIYGGMQERGMRAGTENVPGIVGMAAALEDSYKSLDESKARIFAMSRTLTDVLKSIRGCSLNGDEDVKVPGILNYCFEGCHADVLLKKLDRAGIFASAGSACTSGTLDPSHILLALGLSRENAYSSLRFSIGRFNTAEEINYVAQKLLRIVNEIHGVPIDR